MQSHFGSFLLIMWVCVVILLATISCFGGAEQTSPHRLLVSSILVNPAGYTRDGDYQCSESIVKTIRDTFGLPVPDNVIAMVSGFPVGIGGSGCMCGAIAGGVMALGMFFGREKPKDEAVNKCMALSQVAARHIPG